MAPELPLLVFVRNEELNECIDLEKPRNGTLSIHDQNCIVRAPQNAGKTSTFASLNGHQLPAAQDSEAEPPALLLICPNKTTTGTTDSADTSGPPTLSIDPKRATQFPASQGTADTAL
jgi:hypothetical protein